MQATLKVAEQLIGKYLMRRLHNNLLIGRIVEVEAYLGEKDPASHAYNGRTKRNEVMFRNGGHLYVYFTYGMHFCCNVVTEGEGVARAVLLRAVEPVEGLQIMARNRGIALATDRDKMNLCNGPAKLCEALSIKRKENGVNLLGKKIWIAEDSSPVLAHPIVKTRRIGISRGVENKWRFYLRGSAFVSKGKPS